MRVSVFPLAVALLAGCSTVENFLGGDKVDYRNGAAKTAPLEVPPDLTQLSRDARFQPQAGSISASSYGQAASAAATATPVVAPSSIGDIRIERDGQQRWLYTSMTPEVLWPQLVSFWQERGFELVLDNPETGLLETQWAERNPKIPEGGIRGVLGRVLESVYSTGERDKFRIRVERSARGGSEVYLTHRGMEEVYITQFQDQTRWQPRETDHQLEAEYLSRLMAKLGAPRDDVQTATGDKAPATAALDTAAAPRARIVNGAAVLQVDEGFDRAWRRVGAALDRTGFTVEDRDRGGGLYYVRYVDPANAGKEEPGFWSRLFGDKDGPSGPARYRIALARDGEARTTVAVQNAQGAPENGDAGQRIVSLLVEDLK